MKKVNNTTLKSRSNLGALIESKCAGRGCKRKGVNVIQIRFLRKKGIFCKECSKDLVNMDLVEHTSDTDTKEALIKKMDDESIVDTNSRHSIICSHPYLGGKQND